MFEEMKVNELRETEGGGGGVALAIVLFLVGCLSGCSNSCDQ